MFVLLAILGIVIGYFLPIFCLVIASIFGVITLLAAIFSEEGYHTFCSLVFLAAIWVAYGVEGQINKPNPVATLAEKPKSTTVAELEIGKKKFSFSFFRKQREVEPVVQKTVPVDESSVQKTEPTEKEGITMEQVLTFIGGLFIFGMAGFWILLVGSFALGAVSIRNDWNWPAAGTAIITIAALYFGGNAEFFKSLLNYWLILWVVVFIVMGIGVSYLKFDSWLARRTRKVDEAVDRFCDQHRLPARTIPPDKKKEFARFLKEFLGISEAEKVKPRYWECKGKVVFWGSMWPWVAAEMIFVNMFIRVYEEAYYRLEGFGKWLIERRFKAVQQFLPDDEQPMVVTTTSDPIVNPKNTGK